MSWLSPNLSQGEVIRGSGFNEWSEVPIDIRNAVKLTATDMFQPIRKALGKGISIVSGGGIRSVEMNERCGGSLRSQHLKGFALDLRCKKPELIVAIYEICDELQRNGSIPQGGLALYVRKDGTPRFVHCDRRGRIARWNKSAMSKAVV